MEDYGQKKDGRPVFKIYKLSEVDQVAEVLDFVVKGNIAIVNYSPLKFRNEFELKYADFVSPLISMGIIATSLFFVKSVRDKRRIDSLLE